MTLPDPTPTDLESFISRWKSSGAAERANFPLFLSELCDVIGVERPRPTTENPHEDAYVFEKRVPSHHGTANFIDLYKRGCFVLEAKQGSEKAVDEAAPLSQGEKKRRRQRKKGTAVRGTKGWDTAMEKARNQADAYCRNLPEEEIRNGRPPFLIVVDVGDTIALYSEFTRSGGNHIPFPDHVGYRISMDDLRDEAVRDRLRRVWDDPMSLDPSRHSAKATREIAARLAELAKSLEGQRDPETVAHFLMRCIFTMFAEDVGLLPDRSFTDLLIEIADDPPIFKPMVEDLWQKMNAGGFSVRLKKEIPQFNGGFFADQTALEMTKQQIELLVEAAEADWRDVEPAIFGTLLERALDPRERHKLGAHYTPRAYVERLVKPTIIEPLRAEWESVQAAALLHVESEKPEKAVVEVEAFHRRLVTLRVLDPACGSGNFLYVTLEHLKRLEGEVLNTLHALGEGQMRLKMAGGTVSPEQFLGIEVNPRAAAIAELVLWIGYLQWHTRILEDSEIAEPIIKDYHNIECRDAVLAWDSVEPLLDEKGAPVTRWDGRTMKIHPATGEPVPDETARIPDFRFINPRKAEWPEADYVVGNPPFIGNWRMREALGDGYAEALRKTYKGLPDSIDYVVYWWHLAAEKVRAGKLQRFGLITTNSLRQTFNRRVLLAHLEDKTPLSITFAIPDHPWVDAARGAAVRISMTVAEKGSREGALQTVVTETPSDRDDADVVFSRRRGKIQSDLTIGANLALAGVLKANQDVSCPGVKLHGSGFIVTEEEARELGLGTVPGLERHIRPYRNGRDLTAKPRGVWVIDLFGLGAEDIPRRFPKVYQWISERVKPEREQSRDPKNREKWWVFGRPRPEFRELLKGLKRFIATVETSKHRFFVFLDESILPDNMLVAFAMEDSYFLGVLSSKIHVNWALAMGGRLGYGNDPRYNKTRCFETFPFPDPTNDQKSKIRALAEQLDAHRKRQQAQHPDLTLTGMYNVLEKLRAEEPLTAKEKTIHEQGLVTVLKQLHDDLDAAVFDAYGWPADLSDDDILQRLVDLNARRAAEEAAGHVRWLRPEYQAPDALQPEQTKMPEPETAPDAAPVPIEKQTWPKELRDRVEVVRSVLSAAAEPVAIPDVAAAFNGRRTQKRLGEIREILDMLAGMSMVQVENEKYVGR
ncbi:MAG: class I SAM-dependent DNA methyltransferase [Desulfococcaceae bacterium]